MPDLDLDDVEVEPLESPPEPAREHFTPIIPNVLLGAAFMFNMYRWLFTDPADEHHIEHYLYYALIAGVVTAIQIIGGTAKLVICLRACAVGWSALLVAFVVWIGRNIYQDIAIAYSFGELLVGLFTAALSLIPVAILYHCARTNWRFARHLMAERNGQFLDENYLPEPPPHRDD